MVYDDYDNYDDYKAVKVHVKTSTVGGMAPGVPGEDAHEPSEYCTFQFHKSEGDAGGLDLAPSTVCGTDNTVLSPIIESGSGWPDICVTGVGLYQAIRPTSVSTA
jgi:hypothetical protein